MREETEVKLTDRPEVDPADVLESSRCFVNKEHGVVYWGIEKCGFTSLRQWTLKDFHASSDLAKDFNHHFTVLRDPYERYVSALGTIYRGGYVADPYWDEYVRSVLRYIQSRGKVWTCHGNIHFRPQFRVFDMMPPASKHFRMESLYRIPGWLESLGIVMKESIPTLNTSDSDNTVYALETLSSVKDILLDHYARDLDAYEAAI